MRVVYLRLKRWILIVLYLMELNAYNVLLAIGLMLLGYALHRIIFVSFIIRLLMSVCFAIRGLWWVVKESVGLLLSRAVYLGSTFLVKHARMDIIFRRDIVIKSILFVLDLIIQV